MSGPLGPRWRPPFRARRCRRAGLFRLPGAHLELETRVSPPAVWRGCDPYPYHDPRVPNICLGVNTLTPKTQKHEACFKPPSATPTPPSRSCSSGTRSDDVGRQPAGVGRALRSLLSMGPGHMRLLEYPAT